VDFACFRVRRSRAGAGADPGGVNERIDHRKVGERVEIRSALHAEGEGGGHRAMRRARRGQAGRLHPATNLAKTADRCWQRAVSGYTCVIIRSLAAARTWGGAGGRTTARHRATPRESRWTSPRRGGQRGSGDAGVADVRSWARRSSRRSRGLGFTPDAPEVRAARVKMLSRMRPIRRTPWSTLAVLSRCVSRNLTEIERAELRLAPG